MPSYSIPQLLTGEGLVYGVLGIDIASDYLEKLLPSYELLVGTAVICWRLTRKEGNVIQGVSVHENWKTWICLPWSLSG